MYAHPKLGILFLYIFLKRCIFFLYLAKPSYFPMLLKKTLIDLPHSIKNFLILLFSLSIPNLGVSQNIVANNSFETWPITMEWTTVGTGITIAQEMATVFDGASSCRIVVSATDQSLTPFRQTVNVFAGVDYSVSVWIFQTDNQARARLYIGGFTGIYSDEAATGLWQELTYSFVPTFSGPIEIGLQFYDVAPNWIGGPSNIIVDQFEISPTPGIVANQFELQGAIPGNAGVGLPLNITVCATDGSTVETTYTTPIALNDNGSTSAFTSTPTSPATPNSGCITYTITPTSTGNISLDFGNADFANLQTYPILVESLTVPSMAFSAEIYDTNPMPQDSSSTLNNNWENIQGDSCSSTAGGIFQPVYGTLTYDDMAHTGTINGLVDMVDGTSGVPYTGNATFRLVNMNGPLKGTHFVTNDGNLSTNTTSMQANSPKPSEISADLHFIENTGSLVARNAIAFSFDPPVQDFGVWIGDVETNPFGTNAELLLFYEDALLSQTPILTSSTPAEQMNTGGIGCGSSVTYPGCGNLATRWVEFSGGLVTDALIVVGDDEVGGLGLSEHLSFGGVTIGGTCTVVVLGKHDWKLDAATSSSGILINWQPQIQAKIFVEKQSESGIFISTSDNMMDAGQWLDQSPNEGWNTYRLKWYQEDGQTGYSSTKRVNWTGYSQPFVYPNPANQYLSLHWENHPLKYVIWNYQGQTIQTGTFETGKGDISLHHFPSGRYMCQMFSGDKSKRIPFLVQ